jgi:three-Cys-motif partner protein
VKEDEAYRGREHSGIKHRFLAKYLQEASFKVLQGPFAAGVFNYVDGFAGPWSVSDGQDYSDSSFDNAVRILLATGEYLKSARRYAPKFRFFLCEQDSNRVEKLRAYAEQKTGQLSDLQIEVFEGKFEDNLTRIGAKCREGTQSFTFTFIDPTGWKLRSAEIARFLSAIRGDFMINFMEHPISRHNRYEPASKSFGDFLDDQDWSEKIDCSPGAAPREIQILRMLKSRLKATGAAKYMPDFPILMPSKDRTQMRLVLGTHHAQGVEVFRSVQKHAEGDQATVRRSVAAREQTQLNMFSDDELNTIELASGGVGGSKSLQAARERCLEIISKPSKAISFDDFAARVMEDVPVRMTNIKDIAVELRESGKLQYQLASQKARKPKEDTIIRWSAPTAQ